MRELFPDLADLFPYCLLVALPVFIALSPANPVAAASVEFPAHRAAHFELGGGGAPSSAGGAAAGVVLGARAAQMSLEARAAGSAGKGGGAGHVLRKVVVSKLQDMSVATFTDLTTAGAGGILLLVPDTGAASAMTEDQRESIMILEDHLLTSEIQIPVYFSEETEETRELLETLANTNSANDKQASGAQVLLDSIISNGFQLVSSAGAPKLSPDQSISTLQASFSGVGESGGLGEDDSLPAVVVAAHYDAGGGAPALSFGADANGSGVTILMELARLWSHLYRSSSSARSRPGFNLVFLLTGGGKINFLGTKKWLDEQKDDANSELLSNVKMAVCLDSLGLGSKIHMHVSKPPKEGTAAHNFLTNLKLLAAKLYPDDNLSVEMVHKKINLASDFLAWEHERFSISKLSAFTLSRHPAAFAPEKITLLDRKVDERAVLRNAHLLAEALACAVFDLQGDACQGRVFAAPKDKEESSKLGPSAQSVRMWTEEMAARPRATGLTLGTANPTVEMLMETLKMYSEDVKQFVLRRDKRDPEFAFYDWPSATVSAYRVKPAVFDLLLSVAIAAYLGLVYLVLANSGSIVRLVASLTVAKASANGSAASPAANGHSNGKLKAH